jgi:hypothetical protein
MRTMRTLVCIIAVSAALGAVAVGQASASPTAPQSATSWDLVNAWWSGQTLKVMPNLAGRILARYDAMRLLNDSLNMAGWARLSSHQYNSLLNQLKCHAYFADSKPQWNLDAWRPDVGFWSTVSARCNP